ncbi:MAG: hypothetical protein HYY97_15815 [Rhodocyclales bacterium]|nr:hypothetical protein [Rhodocyclales bacterium]
MRIVRPVNVTDATLTSSSIAENDYGEWAGGTTYGLAAYCIKAATHRIYKSLQAGNTGHDPAGEADPANPVWWQDFGATNRWRMFDALVGTQSSAADSIAVVVTLAAVVDSVVLLNVSAASVHVTMTDAAEGVVYDETVSLVSDSGIQDWYSYFFEPIVRKVDFNLSDLPRYLGAAIAITATDTGGTAAIGECILGMAREIGGTQYGAKIGIRDYSVKTQDDFGNYTILERAFSKRGSFSLWVDSGLTSELQTILASYRATPAVYIGTDIHAATMIYGFYKDFDIDIAYPGASLCAIEIEGLT